MKVIMTDVRIKNDEIVDKRIIVIPEKFNSIEEANAWIGDWLTEHENWLNRWNKDEIVIPIIRFGNMIRHKSPCGEEFFTEFNIVS